MQLLDHAWADAAMLWDLLRKEQPLTSTASNQVLGSDLQGQRGGLQLHCGTWPPTARDAPHVQRRLNLPLLMPAGPAGRAAAVLWRLASQSESCRLDIVREGAASGLRGLLASGHDLLASEVRPLCPCCSRHVPAGNVCRPARRR